MKVIFIHHAGGDKYAWRKYQETLSAKIEKVCMELPGRGDRFSEPLLTDLNAMAEDLYSQILPHLTDNYVLVGKSMGALLAFLLVQKINTEGKKLPLHLFLSSRKAPGAYRSHKKIASEPSSLFWEGVKSYGGCPDFLLQHQELMDLYEPILRADFQALENFQFHPMPSLPVSATVIVGKKDIIRLDEVKSWKDFFSSEVDFQELEGGHFVMYEQALTISKMIEERIFTFNLNQTASSEIPGNLYQI